MKPLIPILLLLASCTKESSTQLRQPNRSNVILQTITVDTRLYKFRQSYGDSWILEVTYPKILTTATSLTIAWNDDSNSYSTTITTPEGYRQTARTFVYPDGLPRIAKGEAKNIRLIGAEGEKNTFYTLKIIP